MITFIVRDLWVELGIRSRCILAQQIFLRLFLLFRHLFNICKPPPELTLEFIRYSLSAKKRIKNAHLAELIQSHFFFTDLLQRSQRDRHTVIVWVHVLDDHVVPWPQLRLLLSIRLRFDYLYVWDRRRSDEWHHGCSCAISWVILFFHHETFFEESGRPAYKTLPFIDRWNLFFIFFPIIRNGVCLGRFSYSSSQNRCRLPWFILIFAWNFKRVSGL